MDAFHPEDTNGQVLTIPGDKPSPMDFPLVIRHEDGRLFARSRAVQEPRPLSPGLRGTRWLGTKARLQRGG